MVWSPFRVRGWANISDSLGMGFALESRSREIPFDWGAAPAMPMRDYFREESWSRRNNRGLLPRVSLLVIVTVSVPSPLSIVLTIPPCGSGCYEMRALDFWSSRGDLCWGAIAAGEDKGEEAVVKTRDAGRRVRELGEPIEITLREVREPIVVGIGIDS